MTDVQVEGGVAERVLDLLPDSVVVIGSDLCIRWANRATFELFGFTPGNLIGRSALELVAATEVADVAESITLQLHGPPRRRTASFHIQCPDGSLVLVETLGTPAFDDAIVGGLVVVLRVIDERGVVDDERRVLERLIAAAAVQCLSTPTSLAETAIDRVLDLYCTTVSAGGAELLVSPDPTHPGEGIIRHRAGMDDRFWTRWTSESGAWPVEDASVFLNTASDLLDQADRLRLGELGLHAFLQVRLDDRAGVLRAFWLAPNPASSVYFFLHRAFGNLLAGTVQRVETLRVLEHLARRDPLTGVANRAELPQFMDRLRIGTSAAEPKLCAVIYADIDGFKNINDTLGHSTGDRVLVETARRLTACVRTDDLVLRLGGDEFAITASVPDRDAAYRLRDRVRLALREPFALDDVDGPSGVLPVQVSLGMVVDRESSDIGDLLLRADRAMYANKSRKRRRDVPADVR